MEQFGDGHHVALRSTFYDTYLYADEDGRGVSLHPRRSSPNAAWVVHRLLDGGPRILLYGVSYGRYLAATKIPAPGGLRGNLVLQQNFNRREDESVLQWEAVRVASGDDVLLRSVSGQHLRASDASATVDDDDGRGMKLRWVVEAITHRDPVPKPPPQRRRASTGSVKRQGQPVKRTIHLLHGNFDGPSTAHSSSLQFVGQSVESLKKELAHNVGVNIADYTLYVQAGLNGRATPLLVDLPQNDETLTVILLPRGTSVSAAGHSLRENQTITVQEALNLFQKAQNAYESQVRIIHNRNAEQERRMRQVPWAELSKEDADVHRRELKQGQAEITKLERELPNLEENMLNAEVVYRRALLRHVNGNAADEVPRHADANEE